jgi:hypothetical protein
MRKDAEICCTLDFIEISTVTACGMSYKDPLGDDFYFSLEEKLEVLGNALISALEKSRYLSSTPEEIEEINRLDEINKNSKEWFLFYRHEKWLNHNPNRRLFEKELVEQRNSKWIDFVSKKYGYKNKKALFKNIQHCYVDLHEDQNIKISSTEHDKLEGWGATVKDYKIHIPANSPSKAIGAAVKYSIARCNGKGADLVAKKLFPDGVPDTFDDYLASLNLLKA